MHEWNQASIPHSASMARTRNRRDESIGFVEKNLEEGKNSNIGKVIKSNPFGKIYENKNLMIQLGFV